MHTRLHPKKENNLRRTSHRQGQPFSRLIHALLVVAILSAGLGVSATPVAATPIAQTSAEDWPQYMHDPAHSARTSATLTNTGPLYLQWAYSFGERVEVEVHPVLANGVLYVGVMNGEMHAINASTGASIWVQRPGGPIAHTAAIIGGQVFFGSLDGNVYALSAANGSTSWVFPTGGPVVSAPAVVDGRVFIGSNDGNLYALDAQSGAEIWRVSTGGPVVSSPAVSQGRVYFGSEDLHARAADAVTGELLWSTQLYGAGMHNTHPVVSDNGQVVIFVTVKPGGGSYVPQEDYPDAPASANPAQTWNAFYQEHPKYRTLYYLNAANGADLWNPAALLFVPMPIPYWGLLEPILAPDGTAWFPAPAGSADNDHVLDHDNRLFSINLSTGVTTEKAGGTLPEFQLRMDEVGRAVFSGNDYYATISEDFGVYRPASGTTRALFTNGDPSGYNFGTHMDPHSPLPSRHLWRYGGAVTMGGVPNASIPIISNNTGYFVSYGWLYAVGPTNRNLNPATSFPSRDGRLYELTYPRSQAPTMQAIQSELEQRVADIIALGANAAPLAARWEQAGGVMLYNEWGFELYGFEADLVRALAEAYPHLPAAQQTQLRAYLSTYVNNTLLNSSHYAYDINCFLYGESGVQVGAANCQLPGAIGTQWLASNPNLIGLRLYALWAYADATGDWASIQSKWSFLSSQFSTWFLNANNCHPEPSMGFCVFELWRVGRLNIGAQIAAAQGMRDMAAHFGDAAMQNNAQQFLNTLLQARIEIANFVPQLYDSGQRQPAPIRLNDDIYHNGDMRIYHEDIFGGESPYNNEMIPYYAELRARDTDPSQVNWFDGSNYRVDAGQGFMYYQALSGYFPLTESLSEALKASLLAETRYYVNSYEVNQPWWWMADLAHHSTGSGEHLYTSPTLSWTMFQVKAHILEEDWNTLARQLPEPTSFNAQYDLYRLQNLVTLLDLADPQQALALSSKTVSGGLPSQGDVVNYTITIRNSGGTLAETINVVDILPAGLSYVPGSLTASLGTVNDSAAPTLTWSGILNDTAAVTIQYSATVVTSEMTTLQNIATISMGSQVNLQRSASILVNFINANSHLIFLPFVRR